MRARTSWALVIALSLLLSFGSVPAFADPPVMDYLQNTIKPLLDTIFGGIGSLRTAALQILSDTGSIKATVNAQPKLAIVSKTFTTMPSSTTPFNLDVNSLPAGQFMKVKRYTVSVLALASFAGVAAGTDTLRLNNCVLDPAVSTCTQVTVAEVDPAVSRQITSTPYAGTNSFVSFERGADGLGPVDVVVNAHVETQP